jgi:hypothetical protein
MNGTAPPITALSATPTAAWCSPRNRGEAHVGVVPVRAFPIAAPGEGISLVSPDGHELAGSNASTRLHPNSRTLIEDELAGANSCPRSSASTSVSSFATPSTWQVDHRPRRDPLRAAG